jgi:hypothetical protein
MKNEHQQLLLLAAVSLSALSVAGCATKNRRPRAPAPTHPVNRRVETLVSQNSASLTPSFRQIYPDRSEIGVTGLFGVAQTEAMLPALNVRESQQE